MSSIWLIRRATHGASSSPKDHVLHSKKITSYQSRLRPPENDHVFASSNTLCTYTHHDSHDTHNQVLTEPEVSFYDPARGRCFFLPKTAKKSQPLFIRLEYQPAIARYHFFGEFFQRFSGHRATHVTSADLCTGTGPDGWIVRCDTSRPVHLLAATGECLIVRDCR